MDSIPSTISNEDIINYYDTCEVDYKLVWHLDTNLAMHYGYWNENTRTLRQALHNMNLEVAKRAGVRDGLEILDAGCGVGGTAINLAMNFNSNFTGITLSAKQVASAQKNAVSRDLQGNTTFLQRDFTDTGFEDSSFDIIYGIESVCHAFEKKDFLKEAYRILKPGGKLVVADFFQTRSSYEGKERALIDKWAHSWSVPSFEYIASFMDKMEDVGFKNQSNENLSPFIQKSSNRLYYSFFPGWMVHQVLKLLRIRNNTHEENLWSTFYQYKALKKGLWSYHMVSGEKT